MYSLSPTAQSRAFELAAAKVAMPSHLGSAEQRAQFSRSMRERLHVSARVSNAVFASELKRAVDEYVAGAKSMPVLIARLQTLLARLGYNPRTGFPGDAALGIPSAEPGSLRDLSSWKRLELIFLTEAALAHGKVQQLQDRTPVALHLVPGYELIRVRHPKAPRDWEARWEKADGPPLVHDNGRLRFIAPKGHIVWHNLGDHALFDDALGVDYSPFWFNSSGQLIGVPRGTLQRLGVMNSAGNWDAAYQTSNIERPTHDLRSRNGEEGSNIELPDRTQEGDAGAGAPERIKAELPAPVVNAKSLDPVIAEKMRALLARTTKMLEGKGRQAA